MGQFGFFDADRRLAAITAKGDPLEMIARVVPFESFRAEIEPARRDREASHGVMACRLRISVNCDDAAHRLSPNSPPSSTKCLTSAESGNNCTGDFPNRLSGVNSDIPRYVAPHAPPIPGDLESRENRRRLRRARRQRPVARIRLIAKKSGNPALTVKSVRRSGARYKPEAQRDHHRAHVSD
jgi:hypothetical protein